MTTAELTELPPLRRVRWKEWTVTYEWHVYRDDPLILRLDSEFWRDGRFWQLRTEGYVNKCEFGGFYVEMIRRKRDGSSYLDPVGLYDSLKLAMDVLEAIVIMGEAME